MSNDIETNEISAGGLRYKSKVSGSPFGVQGHFIGTMSCLKCGLHKPKAQGSFRRLLNKSHFYCGECRPLTNRNTETKK
jgi:hypothetical protein